MWQLQIIISPFHDPKLSLLVFSRAAEESPKTQTLRGKGGPRALHDVLRTDLLPLHATAQLQGDVDTEEYGQHHQNIDHL